jgi:hypothetical protein
VSLTRYNGSETFASAAVETAGRLRSYAISAEARKAPCDFELRLAQGPRSIAGPGYIACPWEAQGGVRTGVGIVNTVDCVHRDRRFPHDSC